MSPGFGTPRGQRAGLTTPRPGVAADQWGSAPIRSALERRVAPCLLEPQATLAQAHKALLADDQMVQQLDAEQPSRGDELSSHLYVLSIYMEKAMGRQRDDCGRR